MPGTWKRGALACCATALAVGVPVAGAAAAAAAHYAAWNFKAESVTVPSRGFPAAHVSTDSTNPQTPSGSSAFLNAATPFGRAFGSSQGRPYALVRSAAGLRPSTTTIHFDAPPAAGTWGLALGDVDAEKVGVEAYDAAGAPIPATGLGWQGSFSFCQGTPLPPTCKGAVGRDVPVWDAGDETLVGNVADTEGASGWFRPTAAVSTVVLVSTVQTGIPAYQVWIAAADQPPPVRGRGGAPGRPPVVTPPDSPVTFPVCEGRAKDIELVGRPEHGSIDAHPAGCTITYTPARGFTGIDLVTVKITDPHGRVLVRSFDVKVAATLPDTGMNGLVANLAAAFGLLSVGAAMAKRAPARSTRDTIDS